jgi:hypothetical protein
MRLWRRRHEVPDHLLKVGIFRRIGFVCHGSLTPFHSTAQMPERGNLVVDDPLEGVKLKIERANSHIPEINSHLDFLMASDSHEIITEIDAAKGEIRRKFRLIKQPPLQVGVVCGEILDGLRSALDHLITATATRRGMIVIENTGFPIEETREKFEAALRKRKIEERVRAGAIIPH